MLPTKYVFDIQGDDLLNQKDQFEGFKALCGLGMHKPFECVGSIAESRSLMKFLANSPDWNSRYVVSHLAEYEEIEQAGELELVADFTSEHCIPPDILARLDAL